MIDIRLDSIADALNDTSLPLYAVEIGSTLAEAYIAARLLRTTGVIDEHDDLTLLPFVIDGLERCRHRQITPPEMLPVAFDHGEDGILIRVGPLGLTRLDALHVARASLERCALELIGPDTTGGVHRNAWNALVGLVELVVVEARHHAMVLAADLVGASR